MSKHAMAPTTSSIPQLAVLGGRPAFPDGSPVPLIRFQGERVKGDFSAVDAIFANQANGILMGGASQQRVVAKILPGVGSPGPNHRVTLQTRIQEFLELDSAEMSVICVSSGTNALRAVLKSVRATDGPDLWKEVIVPQTTVGATVEAVINEGFTPVFAKVDPDSWLLSPEATRCSISEKTAAIITVDWLGTQCDLGPLRKLADEHGIKLISDSAQSFGASSGKPPSASLAHATIYSMGYPKVFTGTGSGGLVVCSKSLAGLLESDPSGILRHEALFEANAVVCLRALHSLPKALEMRRMAGQLYRKLLADIPGIIFQQVPAGLRTNHYQVSVIIDAKTFGVEAREVCQAFRAENVHCSADRMPCVASNETFAPHGRVEGDLDHSQMLATTSVTLPISNDICLDTVKKICGLVQLIQKRSRDITGMKQKKPKSGSTKAPGKFPDVTDLESKFRQHLIVPTLDNGSVYTKILVPFDYLLEHMISTDELLKRFKSRPQWSLGETVAAGLRVDAIIGTVAILAPYSTGQRPGTCKSVALDDSGSAASVTLVPGADGSLSVSKHAAGCGIDGNGAPWLQLQSMFLRESLAAKKTGMFVMPIKVVDNPSGVTVEMPYVPSHSLGELVFANVGAEPVVTAIVDMVGRMATSVWCEGQEQADSKFIQKAHFARMRRRVAIARAENTALDKILRQKTVTLNGRRLDGFEAVMEKLEHHPTLREIVPTILSEIHGDLNIHNILCRLDSNNDPTVALIDPRGVPLLDDSSEGKGKVFERGDYCYDISKLLFSLRGFSEIRRRLFDYSTDGNSHKLDILRHPGSLTMNGAADLLISALASHKLIKRWIDRVECNGTRSFELRVRLGEAAHFVADCACSLGRDTPWEMIPLFLLGLQKLNDVVDLLGSDVPLATNKSKSLSVLAPTPESADFGATMIQQALFGPTSSKKWSYDVLEVSVKIESAYTLQGLLREMVGTYLPKGTAVYISTDPVGLISQFPLVVIHPSNSVRGQTHMLAAATRRTTAFFKDNGVSESAVENLRIVHISSTGSSSRSQFTARDNDKLLSPGTFGISPLRLTLLQANQLPFPKPGRWIVENDSFFLLSQPLAIGGNELCLLGIKRPTSDSGSSWRVFIDKYEQSNGLLFAKSFRNIQVHDRGKSLMRATTGLFLPHSLTKAISQNETDYALRTSPVLVDIVLPRFMSRDEWIRLSHQQGYGVDSHLVWKNAKYFESVSPLVQLANGGDKMAFYHYGSDSEYHKLLANVRNDARLNSLAYAGAATKWRHFTELSTR